MNSSPVRQLKIKVLVVAESMAIRSLLKRILSSDPSYEIVGVCGNAHLGRELLVRHNPQIMILDAELSGMDGLVFLEKVMRYQPTRTLLLVRASAGSSDVHQRALASGAIEVLSKARLDPSRGMNVVSSIVLSSVRNVAGTNVINHKSVSAVADFSTSMRKSLGGGCDSTSLLCIAASTGGPEAIKFVLSQLPANIPPTLIVQHLPANFTKSFAENLSQVCRFPVREATHGEPLSSGVAMIAPGDHHMTLLSAEGRAYIQLNQGPLLHGVRPAADPLFESVAEVIGASAIGVVLTGMGKDGARGLLKMYHVGCYTIAQDSETSVVFGMPGESIALGATHVVSPLGKIPAHIMAAFARRTIAKVG